MLPVGQPDLREIYSVESSMLSRLQIVPEPIDEAVSLTDFHLRLALRQP